MKLLLGLAASLLLSSCAGPRQSAAPRDAGPTVILIALDGFRADYLDWYAPPTLTGWARRGARSSLTPVFPSLTFPNLYSMVTGVGPESHGIVANEMYDPVTRRRFNVSKHETIKDADWWGGEPIWMAAERRGIPAATMFWPGSESEGKRPRLFREYDKAVPSSRRVEQILEWLDLPAGERPRLLTLYLEDVDNAGHEFGPRSPEVAGAVATVDKALAQLESGLDRRGLRDQLDLIVVADHGMAEIAPDHFIALDVRPPGMVVGKGALVAFFPEGSVDEAYGQLEGRIAHAHVYLREQMPERFHYQNHRRIAPIQILADEGWYLAPSPVNRAKIHGGHGYDNELPSMQGIFIALGPAFPPGAPLTARSNLMVDSLVAGILVITRAGASRSPP